jgi:hypothetical protein
MSAEVLRRAADRLEALAWEATDDPWRQMGDPAAGAYLDAGPDTSIVVRGGAWLPDLAYIAAMSPTVGKALAAWLRVQHETERRLGGPDYETPPTHPALAVARAILGESA